MKIRERSTASGFTRLTVVTAFALLVLWPSQALAADPSAFNLQGAIDACPTGGTVSIPAGNFTLTSQVVLKSGITLQGAGVDQTILAMPAQGTQTNLLAGVNVSDVGIKDLTLSSPAASGKVLAIHLSGYSRVTIERVYVTGCEYALKADTEGSALTVRDFTARACGQVYISDLTGGLFERLDVEVVTEPLYDVDFSALYLCAGNHDLKFSDFRARGGSGWTIQLWSDYGPTQASDNIEFDGLDVAGWGPLALGYDFSDVRVFNAVFGGSTERPCIRLYGLSGVLIDGFNGSGGTQLVQSWGGTNNNVTLKNGSYTGSTLVDQTNGSISNLLIENVGQGLTTATALSAISATTLAPSTTTSAAPPITDTVAESTPTSAPSPASAPSTTTTSATWASTTTTLAPIVSSVAKAPALAPTTLVALRTPVEWGTIYRGRVPIRVSVSSSQKIAKVVCYVDGRRVGRDYRAPYSFSWNARKAAQGSAHIITVVAYSRQGIELGRASHRVVVAAR